MNENTELAQIERPTLLRPIATSKDILAAQAETTTLITEALKDGTDYGVVPGTKGKPSLFKAGAERLNNAFGVYPVYSVSEQEIDHDREVKWSKKKREWDNSRKPATFTEAETVGFSIGLYRYVIKCDLRIRGTDVLIGSGIGTCSSLESKYIDRPRDCENTVCKMAQKRAFVAATLNAYGLSNRFTQDVEDINANKRAAGGNDAPIDAEFREEPAKTPQQMALEFLRGTLKMTDDQLAEFKAFCIEERTSFAKVALESQHEGVKTIEELWLLIKEGRKPGESIIVPADEPKEPTEPAAKPPRKTHKFELIQSENAKVLTECASRGIEPVGFMNEAYATGGRTFEDLERRFAKMDEATKPVIPPVDEFDPFGEQEEVLELGA